MLKHVKSLIKRRDKLYKIDSTASKPVLNTDQEGIPLDIF
jgi:hypothetical protein